MANQTAPRFFSVELANRFVPYARKIVEELKSLFHLRSALYQDLRVLSAKTDPNISDLDALSLREKELKDAEIRAGECRKELERFGIMVISEERGLLDFPTMIKGLPAYFSWSWDENAIHWWHRPGKPLHSLKHLPSTALLRADR